MRGSRTLAIAGATITLLLISTLWAVAGGARAAAPALSPSCADSWRNPAGGTWATASDWSTGAPPTPSQRACITIPLSAPVRASGKVTAAGLTLGGARGSDELLLNGAILTLGSASTIARTGVLASQGGSSSMHVARGATLVNHGKIAVAGALDLSGSVTNAGDGLVAVALYLYVDTGRFTNRGTVSVQASGSVQAPHPGSTETGAVIANAGGTIVNLGTITVNSGATFEEGAGALVGAAPALSGRLALRGIGHAAFNLVGSVTLSGTIAASQTLFLAGARVTARGPLTNRGTVIVRGGTSFLTLPAHATLTNAGSIVAAAGSTLFAHTTIDNRPAGRIAVVGGQIVLDGPVILANHGTVTVGSLNSNLSAGMVGAESSTLSAGTAGRITNAAGTIANWGTVLVPGGGTFVEGAGTTSGYPVTINGALDLAGTGSSAFATLAGSAISGDIAAGQTVRVNGSSIDPTRAVASFTNRGALIVHDWLALPPGGTLTNAGTLEVINGGAPR